VLPVLLLAAIFAAAVLVMTAIVWPEGVQAPVSPWVSLTQVDELPTNEPVKFSDQKLYLVKLEDGEILALSQKDPHLGCSVPFRPEFEFMERRGWFRTPCHGETYDLRGVCYVGPCRRGLDRYEVLVVDGKLQVNTGNLIEGPPKGEWSEPVTPN
jgi:nitrite reductase/ring-hydroxylating ferredoxin subunit